MTPVQWAEGNLVAAFEVATARLEGQKREPGEWHKVAGN